MEGSPDASTRERTSEVQKIVLKVGDHRVDGMPAIKLSKNRYYN